MSPTSPTSDGEAAPLLTARNLSKRFGALTAPAGVDLDIHAGEVLVLLGDNGVSIRNLAGCTTAIVLAIASWCG